MPPKSITNDRVPAMSPADETKASSAPSLMLYAPLALGLLALYVPSVTRLWETLWQKDEYSHAPLILAAAMWLLYEKLVETLKSPSAPAPITGGIVLAGGLVTYIFGRSQGITIFEIGSMMPIIAGGLAIVRGWHAVRISAFPIGFIFFAAPLPGFIVDYITGPLKLFISASADYILHAAGYPIGRDGVALSIGQYRLMVADACSGMNSLISLIAVGLFFMYLVGKRPRVHNLIIAISIPVIAIFANLIRVITLCLITYYFGDEAAQGLLHGLTGVFLFAIALTLLFALDSILMRIIPSRNLSSAKS